MTSFTSVAPPLSQAAAIYRCPSIVLPSAQAKIKEEP